MSRVKKKSPLEEEGSFRAVDFRIMPVSARDTRELNIRKEYGESFGSPLQRELTEVHRADVTRINAEITILLLKTIITKAHSFPPRGNKDLDVIL